MTEMFAPSPYRTKRILLIDHDEELLKTISLEILKGEYTVVPTSECGEALSLLEQETFDFIIIGLLADSHAASFEFIQEVALIKKDQINYHLPMIATCPPSHGDCASSLQSKTTQIIAVLEKPLKTHLIIEHLNRFFNKHEEIAEREKNISVKIRDLRVPLQKELTREDHKILGLLTENLNARTEEGSPALIHFIKKGEFDLVMYFLQRGSDPNMRDKKGLSPIFYPVMSGDYKMLKLLLDFEAQTNITTPEGKNLFYMALEYGHLEIVKILLNHGVKKNEIVLGESYLHIPLKNKNTRLFAFLTENGFDPKIKNNHGNSCIDLIKRKKLREFIPFLKIE